MSVFVIQYRVGNCILCVNRLRCILRISTWSKVEEEEKSLMRKENSSMILRVLCLNLECHIFFIQSFGNSFCRVYFFLTLPFVFYMFGFVFFLLHLTQLACLDSRTVFVAKKNSLLNKWNTRGQSIFPIKLRFNG